MKGVVGIVAGALCALVIACAGGSKSAAVAPAPAATAGSSPMPDSPHAQIDALAKQIADARTQMGLPAESAALAPCVGAACPRVMSVPPPTQDPACQHSASETCASSCRFADSICANAGKICDIAKQLGNDDWANGKCTSGENSCKEAKQRCCGCQ